MVLAWRRELDPNFRVHLVLAPDITPPQLKDPPLMISTCRSSTSCRLTAIRRWRNSPTHWADSRPRLPPKIRWWADSKSPHAHLQLPKPEPVKDAERELQLRLNGWESNFSPVRRLSVGLAQYGFWRHQRKGDPQDSRPGLNALRLLEERLKGPAGVGASILTALEPSWVDTQAAGQLYAAIRSSKRRVLVVIAQYEDTLRHHIACAWSPTWSKGPDLDPLEEPKPEMFPTRLEALVAAVHATYRPRLPVKLRNKPAAATNKIIDDLLKKRNDEGVPHVFYIDGNGAPAVSLDDLVQLQAAMPYIACAWLTGVRRRFPESCRVIRPIITSRLEMNAMADYAEAYSILVGS